MPRDGEREKRASASGRSSGSRGSSGSGGRKHKKKHNRKGSAGSRGSSGSGGRSDKPRKGKDKIAPASADFASTEDWQHFETGAYVNLKNMDEDDHTLMFQLKSGKKIAYCDRGPTKGRVLVHHHAAPGSRLERPIDISILKKHNIRFICIDRPGYGESEADEKREIMDWPWIVAELMDQLGVKKFAVSGWNMGTVFALACCYALGSRVQAATMSSVVAPFDRKNPLEGLNHQLAVRLARWSPAITRRALEYSVSMIKSKPARYVASVRHELSKTDNELLTADRGIALVWFSSQGEAYVNGTNGHFTDIRLVFKPWGFDLSKINTPVLHLWHGEEDKQVPRVQTEYVRDQIDTSEAVFVSKEGNLIQFKYWDDMLAQLVEEWK